ncbi:MAG: peptide chain release factor 1 [Lentisphaeria bacterium]|nr:peptide chain release factor 1 [Lentisphaeria bacterium]MBQ7394437.1 peptide chain release factor 1 [Lentisphaeria bacterium]
MASHLESLQVRFAELEKLLADPALYGNPEQSRKVSSEHRKLEKMFRDFAAWKKALADIDTNKEMIASEEDTEMRALAEEDLELQQKQAVELENALQIALLPPDPNDERNIIVEIKPAAGGDEAALFAGELSRAYLKYAESREWRVEILDQSNSDLGGIKNITFSLTGTEVYSRMKFESGVHRVQRVPETEAGGRIHTSTVTVSVMPEAAEVELDIRQEDLRFDVFRSSGPGGQCVNTTDSAVRVTHIPTGLSVASQQEKSQHRNKEIALRILYARLLEIKQQEEQAKFAADKRSLVGSGDRSERIRTYNFPQNRITDHRFAVNIHGLPAVMEGDFDQVIDPILLMECERRLEQLKQA